MCKTIFFLNESLSIYFVNCSDRISLKQCTASYSLKATGLTFCLMPTCSAILHEIWPSITGSVNQIQIGNPDKHAICNNRNHLRNQHQICYSQRTKSVRCSQHKACCWQQKTCCSRHASHFRTPTRHRRTCICITRQQRYLPHWWWSVQWFHLISKV